MTIRKRFMLQFFIQLLIIFVSLLLLVVIFLLVIGFNQFKNEAGGDLSQADEIYFSQNIIVQDNEVFFDDELKELVQQQKGYLLLLTLEGKQIGSLNAPSNVQKHFSKRELTALLLGDHSLSESYSYWKLDDVSNEPVIVLYRKPNIQSTILHEIKISINWEKGNLNLSESLVQKIKNNNGWVLLIDANGKVLSQYGDLEYSWSKLHDISENNLHDFYFNNKTNQTVIVGVPKQTDEVEDLIGYKLLLLLFVVILTLFLCIFWYTHKFAVPVITIMNWIENIGNGVYERPTDLQKKGKIKRKYRLYQDLIETLSSLMKTLKQTKKQRERMNQTREEWISGLSHDLKTPLSSISGYAQMLESNKYTWTNKEVKEFAKVISKKTSFMMELLEDLTLTFRLKNDALPIVKETSEMNELLRQSLIFFINNPANSHVQFEFQPYYEDIYASIDQKWFRRVMDNLITNAIKYNPIGTTITVSISRIEKHLLVIKVNDNGIGMDEETVNNLFQRYYRGTHTTEMTSGSGLGMAIAKQLILLHNGAINVKSGLTKGTSIRILIPIN
ncbi:HAMP domain-containing sensor histidine kinase [Bacillus carboniphilus]|uniref:histidine kinase n=1 Tax=Bacillus carboniphilus TaxID=86663 RepID=A0ABY9JRN3_9BACI|nr:HAMP domain-containing sensor histidine kinase [Bacillus carboniphilus]WLR42055.1 HAMP domain-containing sensor histidine kinase [Bacillus carboniphilus]